MRKYTDKQITQALVDLQCGNTQAFAKLYEYTNKQLYSLCYTYFHSRQDSEDALHSSYLTIIQKIELFNGKKGFNWIYTITKNTCLNILKHNQKVFSVDFQQEKTIRNIGNDIASGLRIDDESGVVAMAKQVLNEHEFRIVILHAVSQVKFRQIACIMEKSEATVRWQYNNALKKLRKEFERRNGNEK